MIALLIALSIASAQPGRVVATGTMGAAPLEDTVLRGSLDYGIFRHLSLSGELGTLPGGSGASLSFGPMLEPIDGRWWRVGLTAQPELHYAAGTPTLAARGGLRVSWLAFWGLSFTGRLDRVQTTREEGWTEWGAGLSVRM